MKGKGPRFERETIINFNEEEKTASIWTASEPIYRKLLKRLGPEYLTEDGERHAVFTFPRNFLGLPRIKTKKELDPTRRAKLAASMSRAKQIIRENDQSGVSEEPDTDI